MKGTREALLAAAARVVRAQGVAALTLEAVAAEAHVSKGGLLYHFPSKDALIRAMVQQLISQFDAAMQRRLEGTEDTPGRWLRAYLGVTFEEAGAQHSAPLTHGLLAAAATDPDLLGPARTAFAAWQERALADGLDPGVATIIRLTVDALWLNDLLGLGSLDPALRDRVLAQLMEWSRGGA